MFTFNHSGKLGDILFSFYFCKELVNSCGDEKFNFHIQTNVKQSNGLIGMNIQSSNFIKPLIEKQNYINEITIGDEIPNVENIINLVNMRNLSINIFTKDIRSWYYNLVANHLPKQFWKPIIQVEPNYKFKDKIIFSWTNRYQNLNIDYNCIREFKDHLIFIGLKEELEEFSKKYFDIEYLPCLNMLQMAQYLAGAKGFVGNPGGNLALAECLKIPRILISPEWVEEYDKHGKKVKNAGPVNVHSLGGWNEFAVTNQKLYFSLKKLINYKREINYVYI